MAAHGSSPTYYDFDMFQEMQVTTGGADLSDRDAGRRAELRAEERHEHAARLGAHLLRERGHAVEQRARGPEGHPRRHHRQGQPHRPSTRTTAFELGGPIVKDRLWAWGAYGNTDVTLLTLSNTPDRTILENTSFKATGQISQALRGDFTFFRGDKLKYGRGAGPTRPPETTWNQSGPTSLYKGEINAVVSNNLFLTGRYGYVDGGFCADPAGRPRDAVLPDDAGIYRDSVRPLRDRASAAHAVRRRQLLPGPARSEVRLRLAEGRRGVLVDRAGLSRAERHHHHARRLPEHDRRHLRR